MIFRSLSLRRLVKPLLATGLFLATLAPARAAVTTAFACPSSGHNGNHDAIFNGFFVQPLNAMNLHSVQLFYTTDTTGTYTLTLTARRNSYAGPQVGTTQTKTVALSSSSDTAVTWDFGDAAFPSGAGVYFTHTESGPGGVQFNMQANQCAGDEETVGTSSTLNGFSVAVAITQNVVTTPTCAANATTLCIDNNQGDKRFQIRVTYSTTQSGGLSGNGQAIPLASLGVIHGGLFWFFGADNPELLIKVLNGCPVNNHFWIFYSAGTNVGFHVTVTDVQTGHSVTYTNPDLTPAPPLQDTGTLPCS
ncbi:MAG TPA: hypothetical protein VF173_15035 [Thermoanaerobaculia bacterium]|nr:hypothetical protein [Thermoanaerobaculia bacterium]